MHDPSNGRGAPPRRPLRRSAILLVAVLSASAPGCSRGTQLSGENRELIVSLATAVSTREPKWLEENVALIEKRRAEGHCPDAEYAALKDVVAKAKAGQWDAAQEAAYALRDAQEPTAEDLENLDQRKLSHEPRTLGPPRKTAKKS
ncbi:hypothetical protein [Paludisphaera mucosa]|uniref:Lipoprotein n=1 Tax=Paludisphaera mucosa TaxID=3030827 RepID=A0ABT6FDT4_9BACT|nr:hypothetical protein [Paludisphaera mucosa]MDG3005727.1 hypothetical protein [Paludisphaera mucosa]